MAHMQEYHQGMRYLVCQLQRLISRETLSVEIIILKINEGNGQIKTLLLKMTLRCFPSNFTFIALASFSLNKL